MSYFAIKLYAMLFMLVDHIGLLILNNDATFRTLGRMAFPLFCFLLVNGYYHTKSKWKYLGRMLIFAALSEPVFDYAVTGRLLSFNYANVFFTLALGLLGMIISDKTKKFKLYAGRMLQILVWIILMFTNELINADYGYYGIVLIGSIYCVYGVTERHKQKMAVAIVFVNILYVFVEGNVSQMYSILAVAFILMFEDKQIYVPKWKKIGCYWFYPLHLLILILIRQMF